MFRLDDDISIASPDGGASASCADSGASLMAGILEAVAKKSGPRLLLAEGTGPEGAALSEAAAGIEGLRLALLYPRSTRAAGLHPSRLAREGGSTSIIAVRGGPDEVAALLAAAAGRRFGPEAVTIAGPSNPARLAARIVSFAANFVLARAGATGEIYFGLGAGDGIGLAACLWAWRLGIPLTGAVLPRESSTEADGSDPAIGGDSDGRALVARLETKRPGLVRSLVLLADADRARALAVRERLEAIGGPAVDLLAAAAVAAAESLMEGGLRGHARILVHADRHPAWSEESVAFPGPLAGRARNLPPDAEIEPDLGELEAALAR